MGCIKSKKKNIEKSLLANIQPSFVFKSVSDNYAPYLWCQLFKQNLIQVSYSADKMAKEDLIEKCREYYRGNDQESASINEFERTYESSKALEWYTKNTFLYKIINESLRSKNDIDALYTFRYYISDLCTCLLDQYRKEANNNGVITVYRGVRLADNEILKMQHSVGKVISINGFVSTSRDRNVAEMFAGNVEHESVMYEIALNVRSLILADISSLSQFIDEQEVLLDIGSIFLVVEVSYQQIWTIKLKSTKKKTKLAIEYIKSNRKLMTESQSVLIGRYFAEMGEYYKSIRYLHNLLNRSNSTTDLGDIYLNLGRAYGFYRDYQNAFKYFQLAYKIQVAEGTDPLVLATILSNMGAVHYDDNRALLYHSEALRLGRPTNDVHPSTGTALYNIGNIYFKRQKYSKALDYYRKSLKISKKNFPKFHPTIAIIYEHIGNVYRAREAYRTAVRYYITALKMYEKILPANHLLIRKVKFSIARSKRRE
ncbi:unnamed protein product [Didymodactylos carnosus]|uniref:NAD(P)(+)--arginine ADP-ribosyltransferase n=1 Tax=Didymodactylos carnosus TaxID=1234261 RepID=A0A814XCR9_9BILA|nr:unnamed protein product [Didymodactylos carnosus]CAF1405978.1 unnamed protein product [Didymodactylos carnosus]CAF3977973.1 unnamed protein product [Didymodactylos carnosus]CAF4211592.1 unnamed protein product [Didymodactylos carnosus]